MSNELDLNELGLGDNSQSAINEKMPRRGASVKTAYQTSIKDGAWVDSMDVILCKNRLFT